MNFFEFADNIKRYDSKMLLDDLQVEIEKSKDVVTLQLEQWDKGEDSNGKVLGYYSLMTEILSGGRKKQGERYNLLDTGDFRSKTYLFPLQKQNDIMFNYDSSGKNTSVLLDKIGPTIFGLQPKNKEQFTAIAVEKAIQLLKINLKIQ